MTAKPRPVTRAVREFRRPDRAGTCVLEYRADGTGHRVVFHDPDESFPVAHRYDAVDQARLCWKVIQDRLTTGGYERV